MVDHNELVVVVIGIGAIDAQDVSEECVYAYEVRVTIDVVRHVD